MIGLANEMQAEGWQVDGAVLPLCLTENLYVFTSL